MKILKEKLYQMQNKLSRKHIFITAIILFLFLDLVLSYNNLQNKTPIFGLKFEGVRVTFSSQKALQMLISQKAHSENVPLLFSYEQKMYTISQKDIDYTVDSPSIANTLLMVGRRGSFGKKLFTQFGSLLGLENVSLSGKISKTALTLKILEIQNDINSKPIPIRPDFIGNMDKILPAQSGIQVDGLTLAKLIVQNISHPQTLPIPLPVKKVAANTHTESELIPIREQAQKLSQQPITISAAGKFFTLSVNDIKSLLTVVERPDYQNPLKTKLVLRLDDTKLSQKLDSFAAQVETLTNTEFDYEDALAEIYGQFYFNNHVLAVIPTGNLPPRKVLGAQTPARKIAYLTFDDGPNTIYHPLILDILKQYHVKATFFLIGNNIRLARDVAIRTYTDGHLVGNHTLTHSFLPNFSSAFISNEMLQTDVILKSINGNQNVKFFRPPYGGINQTVIQDAHTLGLQVFLWDVDPRDWAEPTTNVLVERVINYVHNGSDVLMHSNHLATVKALPIILQTLIAEGYTFQTLDHYPAPEQL